MVTILLQQIIDILKEFFEGFIEWTNTIGDKIAGIKDDTEDIATSNNAIKANSDDIKDNTAAVITPVNSIKTNSDSIKTDTTTIKNTVGTMSNQLTTISTNVGSTAAFTEDTATNTLNILDKVTTIASDTTQIRADNQVLISNTNDLETYVKLLGKGIIKESYSDGTIVSFNTDLKNILNSYEFVIPPSTNGFTSIEITVCGINLLDEEEYEHITPTTPGHSEDGGDTSNLKSARYRRIPSDISLTMKYKNTDPNSADKYYLMVSQVVDGIVDNTTSWLPVSNTESIYHIDPLANSYIRLYLYCPQINLEYPFLNEIIITKGTSEDYEYTPFKGKHFYIDLGETLTIGGKLNVKTGLLTRTDGTTKQLQPLDIKTLIGDNNIFNSVAGFNDISYNESIYNVIEREV